MAPSTRPLRVLYLFSGTPRKLDMAACLQQLATSWTLELKTECVDVKRSAKHDLSLPKVRQSYLDRIAAKEFDAVLLSPPCSSFSRATWANFRGLQTLTPAERDRAITGNIFADFSYEVAALVADGAATFLAMEQPEDLGALETLPPLNHPEGARVLGGKRTLELILAKVGSLKQLEKEAFRVAAGGEKGCRHQFKEEVPGDPASQTVYVNLVGLTYHLLGPDFALDLLLYADDLEAMGKGLHSLEHLFPAALCYPFKWAKTR
ncbi:unnamed protein product, partial [Symbiodinium sp. KB8]